MQVVDYTNRCCLSIILRLPRSRGVILEPITNPHLSASLPDRDICQMESIDSIEVLMMAQEEAIYMENEGETRPN